MTHNENFIPRVGRESITAVVLAGGKGRRFEGRDKGLIEFHQRPIVAHVIDALIPQVAGVMINANRSVAQYESFGYPVINDELSGFQGPLAGFAAAMENAPTSHVLILPCDGPFILPDYARRMARALIAGGAEMAVAHDGERMQPVHALIPVRLLDSLKAFLDSGERKIDRWYVRHSVAMVDFTGLSNMFKNINTQEQLRELEAVESD
jgi:molybdenum cofactor guanylyltransferase